MLNYRNKIVIIDAIEEILDEMFIEPTPDNSEQIGGIIANYLEQEYPEAYDIFDVIEILEEVISNE